VEYRLPILQEKEIKIVIRGLIMLKDAEFRTKEAPYIYCQIFINYFFYCQKRTLKYKIIIQNPSAKPEKVLQNFDQPMINYNIHTQ